MTDVVEVSIAEETRAASNHWPESFPAVLLSIGDARPTSAIGSRAGRFHLFRHGVSEIVTSPGCIYHLYATSDCRLCPQRSARCHDEGSLEVGEGWSHSRVRWSSELFITRDAPRTLLAAGKCELELSVRPNRISRIVAVNPKLNTIAFGPTVGGCSSFARPSVSLPSRNPRHFTCFFEKDAACRHQRRWNGDSTIFARLRESYLTL